MLRRTIIPIAVVALALGGLAACGGDDDDDDAASDDTEATDDTEAEATTTTAAPLEGPPIKIMTIGEFSAGVSNPEIPEGIQGAAEGINSRGGINGSPLEVIVCDTNNDPNTAAECGRQAVDEGVAAVVGGLTLFGGEYFPLLEENKIAAIGNVLATVADFTSPVSYPVYGGIISTSAALPYALAVSGAERIATARIDLAEGVVIPLFGNTALATVGQEYVADVPIPPNTADMATYVAQTQAAEPDGVVVALPAQDSLNFLTEILAANPEIKAALVSTETDAVREALGDEIADRLVYNDSFVVDEESEVYQQYLADMEAAGFDEVGDFRNDMYAATVVFAEIAKQLPAGQVTAAGIWDLLPTQTEVRTGLTPPINFSAPYPVPNSPIPGLRVFNVCVQIATLDAEGLAVLQPGFIDPFTAEECPAP
jgi:ABC-type branched-subunit amino acid transport system substrate-binding protein